LDSISTDGRPIAVGGGLGELPPTPASHFTLCFLGAVLHVLERLADNLGSISEVVGQFPFIADYLDELDRLAGIDVSSPAAGERWLWMTRRWEREVRAHLPLRALRATLRLDDRTMTLLLAIGLIEEDPRFGFLIETAQPAGTPHRPTLGLLTAWWRDEDGVSAVRAAIRVLLEHGLVQVVNHDAPRLQWTFQSPAAIWDALRGDSSLTAMPGVTYTDAARLPDLGSVILPHAARHAIGAIPSVLRSGDAKAVILRGPRHNGRRTIARAVAAALGRGVLELHGPVRQDDERWSAAGVLATLLHAMPVVSLDLGLGDTCELPRLKGYDGPVAVVAGRHGAVTGDFVAGAITVPLAMPGPDERCDLWKRALAEPDRDGARALADRFRMTSGSIFSASCLAHAHAALEGRSRIAPPDVRVASRALHGEIERLAAHVPASGGWERIGAAAETLADLRSLETRCRHRERLRNHVGPALEHQLNCGVRALFAGPSGTGKTMAARLLASALDMDLYRLDLASVVNKYLGETEKSLDQLFSRAEELDVLLLIDEGDALLTGRTAVQSSNDRYANLETNYLLQRLESFEGLLIVTTNAANRIDTAFQRRMDVVVEFRMPGPQERWLIWQLHLPLDHGVDPAWLQEAALRCELSGGQIRNAVLQASLAALEQGRPICTSDLHDAVHREYRKTGTFCPLPRATMVGV
jgi:ATPase family associated with various cellular activities (AAA)